MWYVTGQYIELISETGVLTEGTSYRVPEVVDTEGTPSSTKEDVGVRLGQEPHSDTSQSGVSSGKSLPITYGRKWGTRVGVVAVTFLFCLGVPIRVRRRMFYLSVSK